MSKVEKVAQGWIGFDLDGTLAEYHGWMNLSKIGDPIKPMLALVKEYIAAGWEVKIFTARVSTNDPEELKDTVLAIEKWCLEHVGTILDVTCRKDFTCVKFYDDRAVQVEFNTGRIIE